MGEAVVAVPVCSVSQQEPYLFTNGAYGGISSENYSFERCPMPPADSNDLDGATVGTIIVASFVGVTLIGGAIAVYQSSS